MRQFSIFARSKGCGLSGCHNSLSNGVVRGRSGNLVRRFVFAASLILASVSALPNVAQAQNFEATILELLTNDLIYDPVSDRIYASVPSTAGPGLGNTITTINPATGQIENSVFVGSEPGPLAISDDGQFIYVGLDGSATIRRYDVATATAEMEFTLGTGIHGPLFAEDIEVLAGDPHAVAVSIYRKGVSPRHGGVAIFDDGVKRTNMTRDHTGSNRITLSDFADVLYGYNNETTEFGFRRLAVASDGVSELEVIRDLIRGFGVDIEFEDGAVYATTGGSVDPEALTLNGTYNANGLVEADAVLGKVYFLDGENLKTFDLATFVLLDTDPIAGIMGSTSSLIRWGAEGLAFRTDSGQVFLLYPGSVPPPGPAPTCEVQMTQSAYTLSDTVRTEYVRLSNVTTEEVALEVKVWTTAPDGERNLVENFGSRGNLVLAPGEVRDLGSTRLFRVNRNTPTGAYGIDCRLLDSISGEELAFQENGFLIQ